LAESTVTSIPCRVGPWESGYYIQSPRTGKRLSFTRELLKSLPRVWGRIVQKTSQGQLIVPFTRDELHAIKLILDALAEVEARKNDDPPLHFGMTYKGINDYSTFCMNNPDVRKSSYKLRDDDTFHIDCHTTDWPPCGLGLWFRHPLGPAMVVAGPDKDSLPAGLADKFNGKSAVFTGAEINVLNAACTATHMRTAPIRHRRRYRGF